jgi:hypothetical protein
MLYTPNPHHTIYCCYRFLLIRLARRFLEPILRRPFLGRFLCGCAMCIASYVIYVLGNTYTWGYIPITLLLYHTTAWVSSPAPEGGITTNGIWV